MFKVLKIPVPQKEFVQKSVFPMCAYFEKKSQKEKTKQYGNLALCKKVIVFANS
jgi:hypothetical protein